VECDACAHPRLWLLVWVPVSSAMASNANLMVAVSRTIVGVSEVVVVVVVVGRIEVIRLYHARNLEPGNSNNYQCLDLHDIYKLVSSAFDRARSIHDRSHHHTDNLHIPFHPRRNPHERLDRSKNFAALLHNVAPTKNFVFDSH